MRRRAVVAVAAAAAAGLLAGTACLGQPAPQPAGPPPAAPPAPLRAPGVVGSPTLTADASTNRATISWQLPSDGSTPGYYTLGVHENGRQRGAFVCYAPCTERTINLITIGDGAFLGVGAVVLQGVTIGEQAYVGAGAVVASDVPARTVAGNPARVVKRYDETTGRFGA